MYKQLPDFAPEGDDEESGPPPKPWVLGEAQAEGGVEREASGTSGHARSKFRKSRHGSVHATLSRGKNRALSELQMSVCRRGSETSMFSAQLSNGSFVKRCATHDSPNTFGWQSDRTMGLPEAAEDDGESIVKYSRTLWFQYLTLLVILLNTAVLTVEATYIADENTRRLCESVETAFTVVYSLEVICRLRDAGWSFSGFGAGREGAWNIFDLILTAVGVLDVGIDTFTGVESMGTSVVRLFRVLRIMRILSAFKALSKLDLVVVQAAREMMHYGTVMLLSLFVFAVLATNLMWDDKDPEIASMFSDLGSSLWSLFKLMTMDGWSMWADKIISDRPSMIMFFGVFIFLSIASVSIVPAIFIEAHLAEADLEKENRQQAHDLFIKDCEEEMLRRVFQEADRLCGETGFVRPGQLSELLEDDTFVRWFHHQGIGGMDDLEDIRLGLFIEWGAKSRTDHESDEPEVLLDEDAFVLNVFSTRNAASVRALWRMLTHMRREAKEKGRAQAKQIRDLESFVGSKFADLGHQVATGFSTSSAESRRLAELIEAEAAARLEDCLATRLSARSAQEASEHLAACRREVESFLASAVQELGSTPAAFERVESPTVATGEPDLWKPVPVANADSPVVAVGKSPWSHGRCSPREAEPEEAGSRDGARGQAQEAGCTDEPSEVVAPASWPQDEDHRVSGSGSAPRPVA